MSQVLVDLSSPTLETNTTRVARGQTTNAGPCGKDVEQRQTSQVHSMNAIRTEVKSISVSHALSPFACNHVCLTPLLCFSIENFCRSPDERLQSLLVISDS